MSNARVYARSLLSNWIGYGANLAVAFWLSPIIVHRLGNESYGLWSLLMSVTGYLGLVDLGVRGGTGRFVNYYLGKNHARGAARVVSTSLAYYTAVGIVVFLCAAGLATCFGSVFRKFPADLLEQAPALLMLLALNVWLGLFAATFNQLLMANNRFDALNAVQLAVLAARTIATLVAIEYWPGVMPLTLVQVGSGALALALTYIVARWKGAAVAIGWRYIRWATFREIFAFSLWALAGSVAVQLVYCTDATVIGAFIGAAPITVFMIGATLVGYARNLLGQVADVIAPDIFKAGGAEDDARLHARILVATRMTMFFSIPLLVGFIVLGREFIELWMGPAYREAASILTILTLAQFPALLGRAMAIALWGNGHIRFIAVMAIVEALANLLLSIALALAGFGIQGVAYGTLVPTVLMQVVVLGYGIRAFAFPVGQFVSALVWPACLAAALYAVPCVAATAERLHGGWAMFWAKIGVLALCYVPIGALVVLGTKQCKQLVERMAPSLAEGRAAAPIAAVPAATPSGSEAN